MIDLARQPETMQGIRANESLTNAVDGVHLNPLGEVVIARAVAGKLRGLGWLPADIP